MNRARPVWSDAVRRTAQPEARSFHAQEWGRSRLRQAASSVLDSFQKNPIRLGR